MKNPTIDTSAENSFEDNVNRAYSDVDEVSLHAYDNLNDGNSNIGDGNRSGMQFASADDMSGYSKQFLAENNVINVSDSDYAGDSGNVVSRISVDVSKADRGKDS